MWGSFLWVRKVKSLEEFLATSHWRVVTVKPVMRPAEANAVTRLWSVGETGSFVFCVEFDSFTQNGRTLLYRQVVSLSSPTTSRYGFSDAQERDKEIARTVRLAKRLADRLRLRLRLSDTRVILLDPSGVRMNNQLLECYLRIAE